MGKRFASAGAEFVVVHMRHFETAQIFTHFGAGTGAAARNVDVGLVFIEYTEGALPTL